MQNITSRSLGGIFTRRKSCRLRRLRPFTPYLHVRNFLVTISGAVGPIANGLEQAPGPPEMVTKVGGIFKWKPPASSGGAPLLGYLLQYR